MNNALELVLTPRGREELVNVIDAMSDTSMALVAAYHLFRKEFAPYLEDLPEVTLDDLTRGISIDVMSGALTLLGLKAEDVPDSHVDELVDLVQSRLKSTAVRHANGT